MCYPTGPRRAYVGRISRGSLSSLIPHLAPDILWSGRSILKGAPFQETDLKDLRYVSHECCLRSPAPLLCERIYHIRSRLEQPQSQLVLVSPRRRISNVPHPEHLNQFTFKHQAYAQLRSLIEPFMVSC